MLRRLALEGGSIPAEKYIPGARHTQEGGISRWPRAVMTETRQEANQLKRIDRARHRAAGLGDFSSPALDVKHPLQARHYSVKYLDGRYKPRLAAAITEIRAPRCMYGTDAACSSLGLQNARAVRVYATYLLNIGPACTPPIPHEEETTREERKVEVGGVLLYIEVHPKISEAPQLRSSMPHPKTEFSKNLVDRR